MGQRTTGSSRTGLGRLTRAGVFAGVLSLLTIGVVVVPGQLAGSSNYQQTEGKYNCYYSSALCTEIANPERIWGGWYVGHDEPSIIFYSSQAGAGNEAQYQVTLPKEPAGPYAASKTYDFELQPTFWFGMAVCDTQSFPETVGHCAPDSDANAVGNANPQHPGIAYMELQFYAPGWVPQFAGSSSSATQWCVALNIDSLSESGVNSGILNSSCQSKILGGVEYTNFAYLTGSGTPVGPPNPLAFNPVSSGQPGPNALYMNGGDQVTVTMHDTAQGLFTGVQDASNGKTGSMTASAANGFGQIQYAPSGSSCTEIPYNFHPAYSTASLQGTVPWAAHSYNIAFSGELGHFDFCSAINANTGSCNGTEGRGAKKSPADGDDNFCFASVESTLYPVTGCTDANAPGFDGPSYLQDWPNGSVDRPTPIEFTSPMTGPSYSVNYSQVAFEVDLPRIEASDYGGTCNRLTGAGCVDPPVTDAGTPAVFYPYYTTVKNASGVCEWAMGAKQPNTTNNFGGEKAEFGSLLFSTFLNGNGSQTLTKTDNFNNTLPNNPCPVASPAP